MESLANRKRKGFMKGKLMQMPIFYRAAAKPASSSSTSSVQYSSKVYKPSQSCPSTGYLDYVITPPKQQKVSFININPEDTKQFEALFGVSADEGVDIKATSYISSVQERFKLEGINHA
ncbi:hypothetical protein HS088_TW15G01346 [Tripterygium wilfordii]|uniref:Uncharacterized protein n=1 Tax=Tripterygium wilfordii TaxID=458696 RepID=A0A7J7CP22_TRIWF|nr:uncharacterized protein LOC120017237 [Tripterygium wilfordii]KAF5735830.1 hypothetical protein HS088_TW15G01346 [Tripterygium wilfordii]